MRVPTIACVLLAVTTPALADGLVVSKKVTTLVTTDKTVTKIKVLTAVPDVLACFQEAAEVDVDLDSDGKKIKVMIDLSDAARAKCLEGAFAKMRVKGVFKARVHLVAKPDPRKKAADDKKAAEILEKKLDGAPAMAMLNPKPVGGAGSANEYSADEISGVIKAKSGALRACYQAQLEKEPKLSGKWTFEIQIEKGGVVSRVKLKAATAKSKKLEDCMLTELKKLKFPAKDATATVTYPFVFTQA